MDEHEIIMELLEILSDIRHDIARIADALGGDSDESQEEG